MTFGNFDADTRSELVVVARSAAFDSSATHGRVWAFDDPQAGAAELLAFDRDAGPVDLQGLPIDVDGDGVQELVVGLSGDTTDARRYAVQLFELEAGAARMTLVHGWIYLYQANDQDLSRAVVGDFDADGREDLAWVGMRHASSGSIHQETSIRLFAYAPDARWTQYVELGLLDVSNVPVFQPGSWAVTAYRPAVGRTDLAVAYPPTAARYDLTTFHFDRFLSISGRAQIARNAVAEGIALAASDVDADGAEEVQFATLTSFATEHATEEQRTVVKICGGGASFGASHFGIGGGVDLTNSEGATHAVFYESETTFGASVGDISDPAEYEGWRYNWGFSIQTVGRRATDTNEPDGYTSRKHSFQYLRFWVEPAGSAF